MEFDELLLTEILEQARISHAWLLASMKHGLDELYGGGGDSDKLKHAISVQKLLDMITISEVKK